MADLKLKLGSKLDLGIHKNKNRTQLNSERAFIDLKSDNLQYNTVERWDDGVIVTSSDGPMFILIDWE